MYIPSQNAGFKLSGEYFKIVNFLLDEFRPESKYPPRSPSIWFYNYEPETPPLERDTCLVCSAEEIFSYTSEPLVGIPFDIAEELFLGELHDHFTAYEGVSKEKLQKSIESYWDSAQVINSPTHIPTDQLYEVYISKDQLPTSVIESSHPF